MKNLFKPSFESIKFLFNVERNEVLNMSEKTKEIISQTREELEGLNSQLKGKEKFTHSLQYYIDVIKNNPDENPQFEGASILPVNLDLKVMRIEDRHVNINLGIGEGRNIRKMKKNARDNLREYYFRHPDMRTKDGNRVPKDAEIKSYNIWMSSEFDLKTYEIKDKDSNVIAIGMYYKKGVDSLTVEKK